MNKNKIALILFIFAFFVVFAGVIIEKFVSNKLKPITETEIVKANVVTTIFPIYDWVKNIVGDADTDVFLLAKNGADIHNFQPSVADMVKIVDADVFIYNGGESDLWIQDALRNVDPKKTTVINCMQIISSSLKKEELLEGMQPIHHAGDDKEDEEDFDEHIWLSIKNAQVIVKYITKELSKKDKKNAQAYQANAENYLKNLELMDKMYAETISQYAKNTLVFADRFPFRYLLDDYNLKYYAAFQGCSSETRASFETILFLAKKIDENKLSAILKIEDSQKDLAYSVRNNTFLKNQEILTLDSMQSTLYKRSVKNDYLGIMYTNLDVLESALR